jgi:pyridinium-3,5-biscarboxylic acid mononucleotide synthase
MDADRIKQLLESVAEGTTSTAAALLQLETLPFSDLGFAKLDLHRELRQGLPEVIFCPGKTAEQVIKIAQELKQHHKLFLATRADLELASAVILADKEAQYLPEARVIYWGQFPAVDSSQLPVLILTAGTADIPVAEEAATVLLSAGSKIEKLYDVGVAGLQRLLSHVELLRQARVIIVVAGMDAALPSVVAGLVKSPVIGVPTSIGYGTSFQGLAALLSLLNSCAAGLTVVNIDNGFGAAVAALRIMQINNRIALAPV